MVPGFICNVCAVGPGCHLDRRCRYVLTELHPLTSGLMAKPTRDIQVAWMAAVDTRIKLLVSHSKPSLTSQTSIFSQLLPIKLGAYEQILHAKVTDLRAIETNALRKF